MKLGKLSLVAVMALGTSAFAIDNVKVNGEAKVWYQTSEIDGSTRTAADKELDYFQDGTNSMAQIAIKVGATADLLPSLSAGVKVVGLTTLGLENNMVGAVPSAKYNQTTGVIDPAQLSDQGWVEEAYLAYTMGKTTAKIGRQALATPLAFTENWNVVDNTFEAAVLLNNDIPDTTLVGAWVGKHNGVGVLGDPDLMEAAGNKNGPQVSGRGTTVGYEGKFNTFGNDGAYAAGVINKSIPNTAVQAWYYNVPNIADAYWLQADGKYFNMLSIGVQYAGMMPKLSASVVDNAGYATVNGGFAEDLDVVKKDSNMFAIKGAVDVAGVNIYAAFSSVTDGTLGFANVATGDKSMVYTSLGSIWLDGEIVAAPDTDAFKVGASTKLIPGITLSASYGEADTGANTGALAAVGGASKANFDYTAWDVVVNTKTGPVDWTAIYTQYDAENTVTNVTEVENNTLRIIASLKF